MVNERPRQFGGVNRLGGTRPGVARPPAPPSSTVAGSPAPNRVRQPGIGLGKGGGGLGGKGKGKGMKRHM
jgi:hypothetical protein